MENYEELLEQLNSTLHLFQENEMKVVELRRGYAKGTIVVHDNIKNIHGFVHGGALFTLADNVAGFCAFATGHRCVTLDGDIRYIRPGIDGTLTCIAKELSAGKTTGVYQADIYNEEGKLLCTSTFTMYFVKDKS